VDFTRQPIIETVITAKEGFKLVIRNSKATGVEEYFVDAVEVVSFGGTFFFRTSEKPKPFLLPATDYEVLEVREARMVLKNVGVDKDKSIKIGGGKESVKQVEEEKKESAKTEKRREKRKNLRRRRGERQEEGGELKKEDLSDESTSEELFTPAQAKSLGEHVVEEKLDLSKRPPHLVPPPTSLISETLEKQYRGNELFKGAFYAKSEEAQSESAPKSEDAFPVLSAEEASKEFFDSEITNIPVMPNDEITS